MSSSPSISCAEATTTITSSQMIALPLELASGGTFSVRVAVFGASANSFQVYRAIVDTGSPYLVLPFSGSGSERKKRDDYLLLNSNYPSTEEIYGAVKGKIDWKLASYTFRDERLQISPEIASATGVIGVLDEALTKEATGGGGASYGLMGLIRNSNPNADRKRFPDPRPTFFEQQCIVNEEGDSSGAECKHIKSFCINAPLRQLSFSTESLIQDPPRAMELIDLRKYGDFVDHYAVKVESISFDFVSISSARPIVAVFDSGLTGCLLIRPFWDFVQKYYAASKARRDKAEVYEFNSVSIAVKELGGTICNLKSSAEDDRRRFYVKPIDLDWFDDERTAPYVIILGQTFLSQGSLTIDMESRQSTFQELILR